MIAIVWLRVRFSSFYFRVFVLARVQIHANSVVNHKNSLNKTWFSRVVIERRMDTQTQISIVTVYIIIQGVGLLVLLWVWVLSVNQSNALFFSDFMNVFCICSLGWISLCVEILYQNRIVSIPESIVLLDESICMLLLDCSTYHMLLL